MTHDDRMTPRVCRVGPPVARASAWVAGLRLTQTASYVYQAPNPFGAADALPCINPPQKAVVERPGSRRPLQRLLFRPKL